MQRFTMRSNQISMTAFRTRMRTLDEAEAGADAGANALEAVFRQIMTAKGLPAYTALQAEFQTIARGKAAFNGADLRQWLQGLGVNLTHTQMQV